MIETQQFTEETTQMDIEKVMGLSVITILLCVGMLVGGEYLLELPNQLNWLLLLLGMVVSVFLFVWAVTSDFGKLLGMEAEDYELRQEELVD